MKKLSIVIYILFFAAFGMNTQAVEPEFPKYILSTKPLLLFDGEYKVSFEKALNNPQHWVGVGLSAFYLPERDGKTWDTRNTIDHDYLRSLKGFGIDVTYKYYVFRNFMYIGGDLFYGHYQTGYDDYSLETFVEDGLTFYEYSYGMTKAKFNKLASNIYFGIGTPIANKFFIDTYIGIGRSITPGNKHGDRFDSIFGFGYEGFYPILGARVGMTFGK